MVTQDAPEAALMLRSYFEAIVHGDSHVDAARAALSRRVPASGGELKGIAWSDLDYLMSIIDAAIEDGFDPDEDGPLLDQIRAELKAPIPEGKAEPGEAAVIERCAKVADALQTEMEDVAMAALNQGSRDESAAAARMAKYLANRIRALSTPVRRE